MTTEPTLTEGVKEILTGAEIAGEGAAHDVAAVTIDPVEERFKELEARIRVLETSLVQRIESAFKRVGHVF